MLQENKESKSTEITKSLLLNSKEAQINFQAFLNKASSTIVKILKEKEDLETQEINIFSNSTIITSLEMKGILVSSLLNTITNKNENTELKKTLLSDVAFNKKTFLVSFYSDDHVLPCCHSTFLYLCTYNYNKDSSKDNMKISIKKKIEINSCVSCVVPVLSQNKDNSKNNSNAINNDNGYIEAYLVGTYLGEILFYYYNNETESLKFISCISSNFLHKEKIVSIKSMINYTSVINENINYSVFSNFPDMYKYVSISSDGILFIWEMSQLVLDELINESIELESNNTNTNNDSKKLCNIIAGFNLRFKNSKIKTPLQINPYSFEVFENKENFINKNKKASALIGCLDGSTYRIKLDLSTSLFSSTANKGNDNNTLYSDEVSSIFNYLKQEDVNEIKKSIDKFTESDLNLNNKVKEIGLKELSHYNIDLSKYMKNLIEFNYEKHFSSVSSISVYNKSGQFSNNITNKNNNNIFISTSTDGGIRIFNNTGKYMKIKYLDNNEKFTYSIFSEIAEGLVIAGTNKGNIHFYFFSINNNDLRLILVEERSTNSAVKRILEKRREKNDDCLVIFVFTELGIIDIMEIVAIRSS